MTKILFAVGVLLTASNIRGAVLLEQEIDSNVWRVQYRQNESINCYEAYRKATCNLVRLAEKQGYDYFAIDDPWVEEKKLPRFNTTKHVIYTLEARVRFSSEPVAGGLPSIGDLQQRLKCGKWTIAYLKDSQTMQALKDGWGVPHTLQDYWDVQLIPGTEMQTAGDTIDYQLLEWVSRPMSLALERAPDEVKVDINCRLKRGTLSWEVYDPTGNIVWEGGGEQRSLHEEKRFAGAAGEWGCRLNLDAGNGACLVMIGAISD